MEKVEEISITKRQREVDDDHELQQDDDNYKRQKSYKDIITLLENEDDDQNDDVSSLISTLQEEIISPISEPGLTELDRVCSGSTGSGSGDDEVMKHLLEASDDELGIPNTSGDTSCPEMDVFDLVDGGHVDGGDLLCSVGEGLWEFEDHEANNYYTSFWQSEVFM